MNYKLYFTYWGPSGTATKFQVPPNLSSSAVDHDIQRLNPDNNREHTTCHTTVSCTRGSVTTTTKSSENNATTMSRTNISGHVARVTIFS